eukprot:jgi/Mesen1/9588/ME000657S08868
MKMSLHVAENFIPALVPAFLQPFTLRSVPAAHFSETISFRAMAAPQSVKFTEDKRTCSLDNSKLYFDIPKEKLPIIFSPAYNIGFFGIEKLHPFDASKWSRVHKYMLADGVLTERQVVHPREASRDDLLVVHTDEYLSKLKSSFLVAQILEVAPLVFVPAFLLDRAVGGTVLAGKLALERGWAVNVGGGFHHASGAEGGGFCVYADITLCIHFAFAKLGLSRTPQPRPGFGTESSCRYIQRPGNLSAGERSRFHFYNSFFFKKLTELQVAEEEFVPELIVYVAGTDVLQGDPLGRLQVSAEDIVRRDEAVFAHARRRGIPIVMLTAGGYLKSNARIIATSIQNLFQKKLIA